MSWKTDIEEKIEKLQKFQEDNYHIVSYDEFVKTVQEVRLRVTDLEKVMLDTRQLIEQNKKENDKNILELRHEFTNMRNNILSKRPGCMQFSEISLEDRMNAIGHNLGLITKYLNIEKKITPAKEEMVGKLPVKKTDKE